MSGDNSKIIRLKNISLTIRKDNYIEDYDRYSHTKEYIELKYRTCGKDGYTLLKESNFQHDPQRFKEYKKLWHNLELGLPLDYLTAIGGTITE